MRQKVTSSVDEYWETLKNRAEVSIAHYRGFIFTGLGLANLYCWVKGTGPELPIGLMMVIVATAILTNMTVYTCALLQRGMSIISMVSLAIDAMIIVLLVGATGGARSIYNLLFIFLLIRLMYFRHMPRIIMSTIVFTCLAALSVTYWVANDDNTLGELTSQLIMYAGVFLVANLQADKLKDSIVRHQQAAREIERQSKEIAEVKG